MSRRTKACFVCFAISLMVGVPLLSVTVAHAETDVAGLMAQADAAFNAGNPALAADMYERSHAEVIASPAQHPKKLAAIILSNIANCRTAAGSHALARAAWQRLIDSYGDSPVRCAHAQYCIGQSYIDEGFALDGESALQKVTDYPSQGGMCGCALLMKAQSQFNRKEYAGAELTCWSLIENYANQTSRCAEARLLNARALYAEAKFDEALCAFSSLAARGGYSADDMALISFGIAMCHLFRQNEVKAEDWCTRTIGNYPATTKAQEAYFLRAQLRAGDMKHEEAMQDINAITVAHLKEYALGIYYESLGDEATAAAHFALVVSLYQDGSGWPIPEPVKALIHLEHYYREAGDSEKADAARAQLEALRARHPGE